MPVSIRAPTPQIRATFKDSLTFKTCPDYYLGFKLYADGQYEEVFNGPGRVIRERYAFGKASEVSCCRS